jgi:hypothetical protein
MRTLLVALLFGTSLLAQSPSFFITDPSGSNIIGPLPSVYQFADTPEAGSNSLVLRVTNPSTVPIEIGVIFIADTNFTVTGTTQKVLSPQSSNFEDFTVNFTPAAVGLLSAVLQIGYAVQHNGCVLGSSDPATRCPETVTDVSTFQGNGTATQLVLTCTGIDAQCNGTTLQPAGTPLDFGNVSTLATSTIVFTLRNNEAVPLNPQVLISLPTQNRPFTLSSLPSTLAPNSFLNFTVIFAPQAALSFPATLMVGSNRYPLQGTGTASVVGDISSLVIEYVDQTGVRLPAQAAINFGMILTGMARWTFIVSNPPTTINAVTMPTLSVSGPGFALAGTPPTPVSIQPGQAISFQVVFSASAAGNYGATLSIGARQFLLTAQTPAPIDSSQGPLPGISLFCGASPCSTQTFTSAQQVHMTVRLNAPAPVQSIVTLAIAFESSVSGISSDPAIAFISPLNSRELQITFKNGSQAGTYNGQSQLTFQTGTTAGTITFTLTYLGEQMKTWSIDVPPSLAQITSSKAIRQAPNLVLTLNGYDNTYSAGKLSFTFYDTKGHVISPSPVTVNAAPDFHQYFFGPNDVGGVFSLQASFPVLNGDAAQVGSVGVALTNSVGSTTLTQTFQ